MTAPLVLDTTALTHYSRAGLLKVLDQLTQDYDRLTPTEVMDEAQRGLYEHPAIGNLFGVSWITVVELDIFEVVRAAVFKTELGGEPLRHLGECATLAAAESRSGTAIIDDRDGRETGRRHNIRVAGSLSLIARGVTVGILNIADARATVDALLDTDMRLPTDGPGFEDWARLEGLL